MQARAALFHGDGRHPFEQQFADSQAAKLRLDEDVLQVDPRPTQPGGVIEKIEGKTGRAAVVLGYQTEIKGIGSESVPLQAGFGRQNCFGLTLVGGQRANEGQNLRHVRRGCGTNRGYHAIILECDTGHTRPHPEALP